MIIERVTDDVRVIGGIIFHESQERRVTIELRIAHTADLDSEMRSAIRKLLYSAFGNMTADAFENALGGVHALLLDDGSELISDGQLIGHASVVQRQLLAGGRALRTGYIEGVAVHPGRRRRGHGARMMAVLERVVRSAYQLGALGASPDGARLYAARGWQRWQGPTAALTPAGIRRTPSKDGWIYVLPAAQQDLDLSGEIVCDWRNGELW
jgi:aminoglycoside 2'-N-acetyltransferase I